MLGLEQVVPRLEVQPELGFHPKNDLAEGPYPAVMDRLPCTTSLMRRWGTLMSFANRYRAMPIGLRISSKRISPG